MVETQQVSLAGKKVRPNQHVCAFFNSKEEEYRVLTPFIKEGFERGERAFHVVDPEHRATHLKRLGDSGIPVADAEGRGQLEVRRWEEAYLRDGRFDQMRMVELIEEVLREGRAKGYPLTRLVANMEWALEDRQGVNDTYDLAKFNATVVMDIMRTHPMVIVGGILQENPFYAPPDEFIRELHQRQ